ncbi:MAG TPA: GntR family transcriptional regulator [Acidimicrobiales bacterium]|nr:GntR family transcriptional regulator [Acidimicrobiales bacterium]
MAETSRSRRSTGEGRAPRFRSISEEVADTLRDMILTGELRPGQQVTQEELANRLGLSTMPVREAFLRLSHEGFIEGRRARSFRVARTTRGDVADIYWAHATLAGELARRACFRADDLLPELLDLDAAWTRAAARGDSERLEELNFAFHRAINRAADAPKLLLLLRQTLRFIPQRFYSLLPGWAEVSGAGHRRILDALRAGDADSAGEAAERHVLEAGELLAAYFDDTGFWTRPGPGGSE